VAASFGFCSIFTLVVTQFLLILSALVGDVISAGFIPTFYFYMISFGPISPCVGYLFAISGFVFYRMFVSSSPLLVM